jgi:hypothetical protein
MRGGALFVVACSGSPAPPPEPLANSSTSQAAAAWRDLPSDAYDVSLASGAQPQPTCPSGVITNMIGLFSEGDRLIATLGTGSAHGVARTWSVRLTRPPTEARLVRVDRHTTLVVVPTPPSTNMSPYFELCPP